MTSWTLLLISLLLVLPINSEVSELFDNDIHSIDIPESTSEDLTWERFNNKSYKLMYNANNWKNAEAECEDNYATLAVPQNEEEFQYQQSMVKKMSYRRIKNADDPFFVVWVGINNLEDYKIWKNIYGDDIQKSGFGRWCKANGLLSPNPREPHCTVVDGVNDGLRDWWCHRRQPFICQK